MKRNYLVVLILLSIIALNAYGASMKPARELQSFDSEVMLSSWDFSPELSDPDVLDEYSVYLVTTTKGDPVFTWFGHTGLMVEYPDGKRVNFDYGLFSYSDDFYANFAMGRLWYGVNASYEESEIRQYDSENRSMRYVKLNLSREKKAAVINFLAYNVRPENSNYLYHYYLDNCSTRIRDIINYATDGELRKWAKAQPSTSFRKEASRALCVDAFWDYLLNFLQSGRIDKPITLWDQMFLPDVLEKAVKDFGLVQEEGMILDNTATDHRPATAEHYSFFRELLVPGLVSLSLCLLFALSASKGWRKVYGIAGFIVYLILGLISSLLLFMCVFSNHDVTWFNENLIFVNPILLVSAVMNLVFASKRSMPCHVLDKMDCFMLILSGLLIALKLILPRSFYQSNGLQLLTIVPIYAVRFLVPFKSAEILSDSSRQKLRMEKSRDKVRLYSDMI